MNCQLYLHAQMSRSQVWLFCWFWDVCPLSHIICQSFRLFSTEHVYQTCCVSMRKCWVRVRRLESTNHYKNIWSFKCLRRSLNLIDKRHVKITDSVARQLAEHQLDIKHYCQGKLDLTYCLIWRCETWSMLIKQNVFMCSTYSLNVPPPLEKPLSKGKVPSGLIDGKNIF